MTKALWRDKWFILAVLVVLFIVATGTKVMAVEVDSELAEILKVGLNGLKAYFDWLLEVLKVIWEA
jgi:LPS O-antigen subunit length determinant protein (WzzB/FepE family)